VVAILALSLIFVQACNNNQGMGEGNPQQTTGTRSGEKDNVREPHVNGGHDNRNLPPPAQAQTPSQPAAKSTEH
jgi:hypothetical protein